MMPQLPESVARQFLDVLIVGFFGRAVRILVQNEVLVPLVRLRILEFPRYASFAQSFPNTIPYSESIDSPRDLSTYRETNQ